MTELDEKLMKRALVIARKGDPSPNPHVGCVVVQGEEIVGEGHHDTAGDDHAEIVALSVAGDRAKGATLYVTLSPCNHEGKTPPCVDAILNAGIVRVVVGCQDPNPHVDAGGLDRLKENDVEVELGVCEADAKQLIAPWAKYITEGLSYLTVKLALSLDGRVATRTGESKWITCAESRARVHQLRANHDAVMVGINTVLTDDPQLTVREVTGRDPIRVVIDSKLRVPTNSRLVSSAQDTPTCIFVTDEAPEDKVKVVEDHGVSVVRVAPTAGGRCDMTDVLRQLAAREVVSVLCEGGAELTGTLLAAKLPDELHIFVAPILLGPRGKPGAVDWAGPERPEQGPRIHPANWEVSGSDAYVHGPLRYSDRSST